MTAESRPAARADTAEQPAADAGIECASTSAAGHPKGTVDANVTGRCSNQPDDDIGRTVSIVPQAPRFSRRRQPLAKSCGFQALRMIQMDQDGQLSVWLTCVIRRRTSPTGQSASARFLIDDHSLDARPQDYSLVCFRLRFILSSDCRLVVTRSLAAPLEQACLSVPPRATRPSSRVVSTATLEKRARNLNDYLQPTPGIVRRCQRE